MSLNFSSFFAASIINATFDEVVHSQAQAGRIAAPLLQAVSAQYGIDFPASPVALARMLHKDFIGGTSDADKVAAPRTLAPMIHALHGALTIVAQSGRVNGLIVPSMAGTWCDPVAMDAAKQATKTKAAKTREAKKIAAAVAAERIADPVAVPVAVPASIDTGLSAAVCAVIAAINSGDMSPTGQFGADLQEAMMLAGWFNSAQGSAVLKNAGLALM